MLTILSLVALCFANPTIQLDILPNETERIPLTVEYLKIHRTVSLNDLEQQAKMNPMVIVVHWTANNSAEATKRIFRPAVLNGRPTLRPYGDVNVSSHFIVDRDGTIIQILPTDRISRHCIGLNHISIGIENIGGTNGKEDLTPEQLQANIELIEYLSTLHSITHLIGHYEYQKMEPHPYFDEKFPTYRTIKIDPGKQFMQDLRNSETIQNLHLNGPQ